MPQLEPISPARLVETFSTLLPSGRRCVAVVDGPDGADPVDFAYRTSAFVSSTGRPCDVVDLHDFVRPASLRFEYSRTDEMTYRTGWFDFDAIEREVIAPLRPGGRGQFLPRLWDEKSDRSARATLRDAAQTHVVILAGPMLLGRGLEVDASIRLDLSAGALRRRTRPEEQWTIEPLLTYYREMDLRQGDAAAGPDLWVRWDHPDRPAVRRR